MKNNLDYLFYFHYNYAHGPLIFITPVHNIIYYYLLLYIYIVKYLYITIVFDVHTLFNWDLLIFFFIIVCTCQKIK